MLMEWDKLLSKKRVKQLYEGTDPTKQLTDPRSEYERDFGRAVFCTPVRRLQDKAQVFPLERHDAVRTRLTHSNEVSSVARGLAGAAAAWMREEKHIDAEQANAVTAIAATCGLIHDVGNPPFGHAGEDAIRDWFREQQKDDSARFGDLSEQETNDFLKFEGNAQTQRLLSKLQVLADSYGLNLTCATLSASCKYIARSHEASKKGPHQASKPGYFASENDLINRLRKETETGTARNPIAYLVEASDDIAYSTVDIEDGIKKGVLRWSTVENELFEKFEGNRELANRSLEEAHKKIDPAPLSGKERDEAMSQAFRTFAINEMVSAVFEAFKRNYSSIMAGAYDKELIKDSEAAGLVGACKRIGLDRVYVSKETLKLEVFGSRVIRKLLSLFWHAAKSYEPEKKGMDSLGRRMYELASPNYRYVFQETLKKTRERGGPETYVRLQLVTDQICGMTDTYACDLYQDLINGRHAD